MGKVRNLRTVRGAMGSVHGPTALHARQLKRRVNECGECWLGRPTFIKHGRGQKCTLGKWLLLVLFKLYNDPSHPKDLSHPTR